MSVALLCMGGCASSDNEKSDDAMSLNAGTPAGTAGVSAGAAGLVGQAGQAAGTGLGGMTALDGAPGSGGAAGTATIDPLAGTGGTDMAPIAGTGVAGTAPIAGVGGAGGADVPADPTFDLTGTSCLKPSTTSYGERGPYTVRTVDVDLGMDICPNQGQSRFRIFYPDPLEAECEHPIVAWGNGTGVSDATTYAFFNENAASHGIVVIASWDPNTGCGEYHKKGLDHLLAENANPSSMFYGKLSTRAGVSGHSQGAGGAVRGASHPNVIADVAVGGTGVWGGIATLCLTGTEDIGSGSLCAQSAVDRASVPGFGASWEGGDHVGTQTLLGYIQRDPGTLQMQRLYAAWFRCFLANDGEACELFTGGTPTGCGICGDSGWAALASKGL